MSADGPVGLQNKALIEFFKWSVLLLIIGLIGLGVYLIWYRHPPNYSTTSFLKNIENTNSQSAQTSLKDGDYSTYQSTEYLVANNYLNNSDVADAERVMDTVFAKVPANQLDYGSYTLMIKAQLAKNDTAKAKHYYQLLVKLLKNQGDTVDAAQAQQAMDNLQ